MTWQPIETAPKDGTEVLLFAVPNEAPHLKPHIAAGLWSAQVGTWAPGLWLFRHGIAPSFVPTHWQPLPSPPTPEGN